MLDGPEKLVLHACRDLPEDQYGLVHDGEIAQKTRLSLRDVKTVLEILDGEGFVSRVRFSDDHYAAQITAKGRLELSQRARPPEQPPEEPPRRVNPKGLRPSDAEDKDVFRELHLGPRRPDRPYHPARWEKVCVVTTALLVMLLIGFLVVRNQPFNDPNLVVLIRTVLSTAVAVLGATIPGFLYVDLSARGVIIRAGGALALFVLTFFFSPSVLAVPPPVPPEPPHLVGPNVPDKPPSPSILEGYVIDAETREKVPGVTLTIQDWDTCDGRTPTSTTDHAGRFRFGDLRPSPDPAQQVRLIARKDGYEPSSTDAPLGTTSHPIKLRPASASRDYP